MTTTTTVTLVKVEDHEGNGRCGHCQREGLRWICRLSDGSGVGTECAKTVLGHKPAPKSYNWVPDFEPVAEHDDGHDGKGGRVVYVMWRQKGGAATRETRNGALVSVGGIRQTWEQRGWL